MLFSPLDGKRMGESEKKGGEGGGEEDITIPSASSSSALFAERERGAMGTTSAATEERVGDTVYIFCERQAPPTPASSPCSSYFLVAVRYTYIYP